ncbi:hypothetical protein BPC006_II1040 [Burkholderia pseudomallei BPC006]|nr:hypothetical protein BPC006_II1040 [Burkholderia pseudomallei BPC006]
MVRCNSRSSEGIVRDVPDAWLAAWGSAVVDVAA